MRPRRRGRRGRILPIHIGGSSLAAARRAGRRGDGYFPGGRLTLEQRNEQLAVMRVEAAGMRVELSSFVRRRLEVCAEDFNSAAGCSASVDTGIGGDQRDVEGFG
jgi:alkanesulfonate monooxygenase SsuD/methylene tetrahydromethanopterin reductase-like flavin-dependent oxidoreductase (luciferase family)